MLCVFTPKYRKELIAAFPMSLFGILVTNSLSKNKLAF